VIFQPSPGIDYRPAQLGIDAEEAWLTTEDGVRIHAFFVPAPGGASRALLFLHGNAGNASHRLPNAALLAALGVDVLLLDYRGYGASEGTPSEAGVYADARAGLAHLLEERGVPTERVVLFGRSLGGAVAVDLAQEQPLAGVILESTFSSLQALARGFAGPLGGLLVRGGFDSGAKIAKTRSPLLFFHGDRDEIVDFTLGRALFDVAPEPKVFETLRGAGHNDTVERGGRAYLDRIRAFLDEVAP
jgi:pimeloyl-ACP methyl ester carboxylesterase